MGSERERERETDTPVSHMQQSLTKLTGLTALTVLYELCWTFFYFSPLVGTLYRNMQES